MDSTRFDESIWCNTNLLISLLQIFISLLMQYSTSEHTHDVYTYQRNMKRQKQDFQYHGLVQFQSINHNMTWKYLLNVCMLVFRPLRGVFAQTFMLSTVLDRGNNNNSNSNSFNRGNEVARPYTVLSIHPFLSPSYKSNYLPFDRFTIFFF